jgi:hypothetical protein
MAKASRSFTYKDYTVGWICALLDPEMIAALAILDENHKTLLAMDSRDTNSYCLGRIGFYNVVVACLLAKIIDIRTVTLVVEHILYSFKFIRFSLVVGVSSRVLGANIRLGDIVISLHSKKSTAVVHYDFRMALQYG